ncbi:unnamed protein product, partial [Ectocarpus sp. 13 AM-2016]
MVEIMDRGREVEWSPDMELEGDDAEKAAALLLAVAPRNRSFDATQNPEGPGPAGTTGGGGGGGGGSGPVNAPPAPPPDGGGVAHVDTEGGAVPLEGAGAGAAGGAAGGGSWESPLKREFDGPVNGALPNGSYRDSATAALSGGDPRVAAVSIASSPSSLSLSTSPRPRSASSGGGASMRLQSLADLATQELQTMGDVDETDTAGTHGHRGDHHHHRSLSNGNSQSSSARTPPPPAGFSPKRHISPRLSGGGGGGRGGRGVSALSSAAAAVASFSAPLPPARAAPGHHHHLRERGVPRSRHERAEEEEEEEEEMRAAARADGGRGRRHRPRSVSMPEGMELQARAWSGGYSSGRRKSGRIDSIKEELEVTLCLHLAFAAAAAAA